MKDCEDTEFYIFEARLWLKSKPSVFIFGSYVGNIFLTNRSLVFTSFGSAELFRSLLPRRCAFGGVEGDIIDFSDPRIIEIMKTNGSLRFSRDCIKDFEIIRSFDMTWYLRMSVTTTSEDKYYSFTTSAGFSKAPFVAFLRKLNDNEQQGNDY